MSRLEDAVRWLSARLAPPPAHPALRIEQHLRRLEDEVPSLNEGLARIQAEARRLEEEVRRLRDREAELVEATRDAREQGRPDLAECYAATLAEVRRQAAEQERQLERVRGAYERARRFKLDFMREKERRIEAAKEALAAKRRADRDRPVIRALEGCERTRWGLAASFDSAVRELEAEAARSDAELRALLDPPRYGPGASPPGPAAPDG